MAITYVGAGASNAAASGNLTLALPAGCQKDDILIADVGLNGSDTLSCSGYTKKAEYSAGGAGMDLVVTLEMLGYGIRSVAATQTLFNRSQIAMNAADYDGATYYFEVVVTTATTTDYNVELYDVTNAAVEATIAMGTTALTYKRLRSTAFTPTAGNNVYAVRIDGTTSNSDVLVFTARIVVVQAGATKTRLQFPLIAHTQGATQVDSSAGATDSMTGNVYGQTTTTRYALWLKDAAKLATIAAGTPWTIEALMSLGTGTDTAYCQLYNNTDAVAVTGSELTHTGDTAITRVAADFATDAVGFTDLDEFELQLKCNHATRFAYVYSANLYVKLTTLTKAQVYTRISPHYTGTAGTTVPFSRITYDSAQWSPGTTWYLEATGIDATTVPLEFAAIRSDDDDTGTGTATLATKLIMTGTRSRQRSVAITLTDELRYMGRASASVGTASFASEFLIAEVVASATDETQVTRFWKRHTGTESSAVITGATNAIAGRIHAYRGVQGAFSATGGTKTTDGLYTVHKFTTSADLVCTGTVEAEVLVVGGGGGGSGGGGGAGGYLTGTETLTGTMTATVGAGGAGKDLFTAPGDTGQDSVFGTRTAKGGGGGGQNSANGVAGGSGGGGGFGAAVVTTGGAATPAGQGNAGGSNAVAGYAGGGGGGAGAAGSDAPSAVTGGAGGAGLDNDIVLTGSNVGYAGGGGGGDSDGITGGAATHGGGAGNAVSATANTGGGGGGGNGNYSFTGGNGGSGIVVVRYLTDGTWDAYDAALASGAGPTATFPALTTQTAGAMVVGAAASATSNTWSAYSYGGLTTPQGLDSVATTLGDDASCVFLYGTDAAAGDIGAPSAIQGALAPQFWVSTVGALKPAPAATGFHLAIACQVAAESDVIPDAVIISLSPVEGIVGSSVAISGSDFGTSGVVKFGSTVATQTSYADSYIVVTVPSLSTGAKTVTVTPTSRVASNGSTFTVLAAPVELGPVETNPLRDDNLAVTVGGLDVSGAILPGLTYGSTNPGGFGGASFRLPATDPSGPYESTGAVSKGAAVVITHSGTTLYEGEVTNDLTHATIEGGTAFYDVTCAGLWWKAGQRKDFCHVFTDDDFDQWFTQRPAQSFAISTDGELEIRLEKGQDAKANSGASLYYWLDNGMGDQYSTGAGRNLINAFVFLVEIDVGGAGWYADISSATNPWDTWTVDQSWNNTTVAAGTAYRVVASTAYSRALRVRLYSNADVAAVAADRFIRITRMSVHCDYGVDLTISGNTLANPTVVTTTAAHGLRTGDRVYITGSNSTPTISGWRTITYVDADSFSVPVNVTVAGTAGYVLGPPRVDTAMADIATSTGLADTSTLQTGGVGNLNWGMNVRPFMSRADAIEMLAGTSPEPLDYGFWDSAAFHCRTRPGAAASDTVYLVDSQTTPGVDAAIFSDTESSPTHVKVLYKFRDVDGGTSVYPDGTLMAVYRPEEPDWSDATVVLDVWDQWADLSLETAQAENIGDQILAWIARNRWVGTFTIAAPTVDLADGTGTKNTAYIRGGDYIVDFNLGTGPLMITSAIVDADSGVATLGIGETREEFVARISKVPRLSASPTHRKPRARSFDTFLGP